MFRLLIVDDEKNERDCLLYLIQNAQLPFEVREAENGADALRILEEWTADVILSDVQMPVMGGLEFLREACALYPETRVIIFSNYAEFEYAKAAMHLGVENYILKPVVPQELENTLNADSVRNFADRKHFGDAAAFDLNDRASKTLKTLFVSLDNLIRYGNRVTAFERRNFRFHPHRILGDFNQLVHFQQY